MNVIIAIYNWTYLDERYYRHLQLNIPDVKSWRKHPTKQQLFGH